MNTNQFIEQAILRGETQGMETLELKAKFVFAISEAEVLCDMEGIDSLIRRYGLSSMEGLFAQAFSAIGAHEIASALSQVCTSDKPDYHHAHEYANRLISARHGYSYESIQAFVDRDL